MQTTTLEIPRDHIAILQEVIDVAKVTGRIDRDTLVSLAETVRREEWMKACAAYLATKETTDDEQTKISWAMLLMDRNDERALSAIAAPYKRGDIKQMVAILRELPLKKGELKSVNRWAGEADFLIGDAVTVRWKSTAGLLDRYGVKPDLKTVRVGR